MRENIKTKILLFMEQSRKKSFSTEEIAEALSLQKTDDFKHLVQTIAQMEKEKSLVITKKGKLKLTQPEIFVEGIFHANERGFGFVTIDPEEPDVFIPKEATNFAMNGDKVAIDIVKAADGERGAEGKIVEIITREMSQVVGTFTLFADEEIENSDLYGFVVPKDKKMADLKVFVAAEGVRPVDGSVVIVEITHYPEKDYETSLEGLVTKVVGHKNDPGMDILSVVIAHGIPTEFPEDVLTQANEVPDTIDPADFPHRRDLRDEVIVTIDGEDAKDLDDAVTVQRLANGNFKLGVYIADVSYYVTEDSPLDGEAFERGTSVYLTDRVIPMLPQRLSNGICSLNPQVPRLAMSCEMEIDHLGRVVDYEIFESVIQTTERMTYTAVNEILEEQKAETRERYAALVPMFEDMEELHHILEKMRERRGAVTFEDKEAKVLVDSEGHPLEILLRSRGVGERLIESFMLAANETIAEHFAKLELPFIYRIHEEPKEEKLRRFFDFASALGLHVQQTKGSITPKDLQHIIEDTADRPESMVISTMLLRSMQQAKYSEHNYGHYGLAAEYYTHFTSPIRRYPDLIVHRLIRAYQKSQSMETQNKWAADLPDIAIHSSQMERRAVEAEREVDSMKKAQFMADHIGEEFDGVISSVVKFGIFIELPNTIEGLIHINDLQADYFHFLDKHLALVGERTGTTYKIGQKVKVKVVKADPATGDIDFTLLEAEEVEGLALDQPQRARRKRNFDEQKPRDKQRQPRNKPKGGKGGNNERKNSKNKKKPFYKGVKKKKKGGKPGRK